MTKHLGYTATREQINPWQSGTVENLLRYHFAIGFTEFHHGDCVGGDDFAARVAYSLGYRVISHPPLHSGLRAYAPAHFVHDPKPYHERNSDIVSSCSGAIGVPNTNTPRPRSGTWCTLVKLSSANIPYWVVSPSGMWAVTPLPASVQHS
jgi:hypothetical protein